MKDIVKASSLIPFLNQKNGSDVKFNQLANVERKEVIVNEVKTIDEEEGTVWCTISTNGVDRSGDVVMPNGVEVDEFKKIPSVYINHDYSLLPIAKCEELVYKDDCIMAKIKFVLTVPVIKNIFELVKAGAMKGISIGFDAKEVILKGTKAFEDISKSLNLDKRANRIISKWKLYEFSLVSIPCNADCYVKSLVDSKQEVSPELTKYLGIKELPKETIVPLTVEDIKEVIEEVKKEDIPSTEIKDSSIEFKEDSNIELIITKDLLTDGRAKKMNFTEDQANAEELKMGMEVEKEHTEDPEIAKRIALDHLSEIKDYYTRLAKMEAEAKEIKEEAPVKEEPKKYIKFINVVKTPEETEEYIKKCATARVMGKTRVEVKII